MATVLASLLLFSLAPLTAITISPPGTSDEGCPSPRQVSDALVARLPGGVLGPGQTTGPSTLRVTIFDPPGGGIRFQLTNADGETVLYRTLPPPPGRPTDCAALSETVALIVDRYLHEVGYEAPPLPPPAPPPPVVTEVPPSPVTGAPREILWQVGVSAEGRFGGTNTDGGAGGLSVGAQFLRSRVPWGLRLSSSFVPPMTKGFSPDGNRADRVTLHRVPLRASVFATLPAGPGRIELGLDLGTDLLILSVTVINSTGSPPGIPNGGGMHLAPFCDAALAYAVPLAQHVFLRVLGRGGVAQPFNFTTTRNGNSVLSTPFAYLEFGVESGVSFP